ncbi:MAG: hypothetical protein KBB55_02460 [Candidatus Buchananbacteria bacterium]|nr:hypothetical protein [Candidatus Buchananbacteria bacterium]
MINRESLDSLIEGSDNAWWEPDLFPLQVAPQLPLELEIISGPPVAAENYNCFIYALGLETDSEIIKDSSGFIYSAFFQHLLDIDELKAIDDPQSGDYVVYRDSVKYPGHITHVGIIDGESIRSKWAWGPIFRHALLEVPASYGDEISYIQKIDVVRARELYWKYKAQNIK